MIGLVAYDEDSQSDTEIVPPQNAQRFSNVRSLHCHDDHNSFPCWHPSLVPVRISHLKVAQRMPQKVCLGSPNPERGTDQCCRSINKISSRDQKTFYTPPKSSTKGTCRTRTRVRILNWSKNGFCSACRWRNDGTLSRHLDRGPLFNAQIISRRTVEHKNIVEATTDTRSRGLGYSIRVYRTCQPSFRGLSRPHVSTFQTYVGCITRQSSNNSRNWRRILQTPATSMTR